MEYAYLSASTGHYSSAAALANAAVHAAHAAAHRHIGLHPLLAEPKVGHLGSGDG